MTKPTIRFEFNEDGLRRLEQQVQANLDRATPQIQEAFDALVGLPHEEASAGVLAAGEAHGLSWNPDLVRQWATTLSSGQSVTISAGMDEGSADG